MPAKTCPECQVEFIPHNNFQKFCTLECTRSNRRKRRGTTGRYAKECPVCSRSFRSENPDAVYCSNFCYSKTLIKANRGTKKTCPQCNIEFYCGKDQVCCSRQCGHKYHEKRLKIPCLHCNKLFPVSPSKKEERKFCCRACMTAYRTDRISLTCQHCGKDFLTQRWYAENGRAYCSKDCSDEGLKRRVDCNCATCGKQFERTPSQAEHGANNYCCKRCASVGLIKVWTDEELRLLCRHRRKYSIYWAKIAARIRKRDKYTCAYCGVIQRKPSLHVHHINPISNYTLDTLDQANHPDNLISLCNKCHRHIEANPSLLNTTGKQLTFVFL